MFFVNFLYSQLLVQLPVPTSSFTYQTIIVTGSNTGLGFEAARYFLKLNASLVILAVRNETKGKKAAEELLASTGRNADSVQVWNCDLSSYDSLIAFGKRVQTLKRLDAVVLNAGILTTKFERLPSGDESIVGVNVVSNVLLGLLVLPKLRESAAATGLRGRLTFVGSDMIFMTKFKEQYATQHEKLFDVLNDAKVTDMGDRYGVSKVLLLFAVQHLASQSPVSNKSNVVINIQTPGACKSDIFRDDYSAVQRIAMSVMIGIVARTGEQGARTIVQAVLPEIGEETHGQFLMDCKITPPGSYFGSEQGRKMARKTVDELYTKIEAVAPGATKV
ncbi:MAG: hypothetical protein M1820_000072 [Bogoriella megaspora]|nr:MAG: hypothetical protein M1820_000072 [Bogoriella megaspora]